MASIEEIVSALQSTKDKIEESVSEASAAESITDELIGVMAGAGMTDKVAELSAVKEAIGALRTHLQGGVGMAEGVVNQAQTAGG
ncbi:hypothetical protein [Jidongwangia harbinensis]|uniref:hypothetical protein n=1 Tax=Jidongwangia harbinensis TaxID=2878561 RepID=UPI001CD9A7B9|nr:hypothetical protein [Jidongwangia harbinensis]MCA2216784.1 hypothetical protein [Jidongwangia harbinensis]